jgi:hypothetical protein
VTEILLNHLEFLKLLLVIHKSLNISHYLTIQDLVREKAMFLTRYKIHKQHGGIEDILLYFSDYNLLLYCKVWKQRSVAFVILDQIFHLGVIFSNFVDLKREVISFLITYQVFVTLNHLPKPLPLAPKPYTLSPKPYPLFFLLFWPGFRRQPYRGGHLLLLRSRPREWHFRLS